MRVKPVSGTGARQVIWNNIISNATHTYTQSGTFTLDATRNLSSAASPAGPPARSLVTLSTSPIRPTTTTTTAKAPRHEISQQTGA